MSHLSDRWISWKTTIRNQSRRDRFPFLCLSTTPNKKIPPLFPGRTITAVILPFSQHPPTSPPRSPTFPIARVCNPLCTLGNPHVRSRRCKYHIPGGANITSVICSSSPIFDTTTSLLSRKLPHAPHRTDSTIPTLYITIPLQVDFLEDFDPGQLQDSEGVTMGDAMVMMGSNGRMAHGGMNGHPSSEEDLSSPYDRHKY